MSTIPADPSKIFYLPPIRTPESKILKYMSDEERTDVERELLSEYTEWGEHPKFDPKTPRANVFQQGRSCHIYNTDFRGNILEDRREHYPKTLQYLAEFSGFPPDKLGRTYWHRLMPDQRILLHHDNSNGYFRTVNRHHIYLDVPLDFHVIIDGKLWNVYDDCKLTNAVVKFNLFDYHFFVNYTQNPVYLLVFDFYP